MSTAAPARTWAVTIGRYLPGLVLLLVVGVVGTFAQTGLRSIATATGARLPDVEYVLWAIVIGLVIRNTVGVPAVFRGPGGAALQLASQHSQAFESYYAHIPGLKVVMPATPADAKGLLKSAIRDDNPVVFIEGEMLYNMKGDVPDGEHIVPLGRADVKRTGADITIVCHSKTVTVALKAAEQLASEEVEAEVLDLRTIRPLDTEALLRSVAKTHRCVVAEEGWPFAGVGAQVVDTIQREAFDELDAPVLRVTGADVPMPYNKHLEKAAKVDPAKIVAAAHSVLYRD